MNGHNQVWVIQESHTDIASHKQMIQHPLMPALKVSKCQL